MYEILTQEELLPFWQYANQHPTVWPCLQRCRIEHTTPGRGTIIEVVPKPGDRDGPKVYGRVRFDEPKGPRNGNHTKTKVMLLPFVLDKRLLKRLALPRAIADSLRPPLPPRKKEWPRFEEIVKRYRIDSLYHFTASRNLDSVRSHGGLYSWWQCEQRGIKITAPGSDRLSRRLDLKKKLEDYVRLSFNASQPMMHVASRIGVGHLPYHASSRNCSATDVGVLVKGAFDLG